MTYTRIEIEVVHNYVYSYKVNEEPELVYMEQGHEPIRIGFSSMEEMRAVAEAMLKVVEYSSSK